MSNLPKDHKRRAAFSMTIGSQEDGHTVDMLTVGKRLYIIKESAIYTLHLADQIDPDCTNPDLPHTNQKLYPVGNSSEIVGRILMQSK